VVVFLVVVFVLRVVLEPVVVVLRCGLLRAYVVLVPLCVLPKFVVVLVLVSTVPLFFGPRLVFMVVVSVARVLVIGAVCVRGVVEPVVVGVGLLPLPVGGVALLVRLAVLVRPPALASPLLFVVVLLLVVSRVFVRPLVRFVAFGLSLLFGSRVGAVVVVTCLAKTNLLLCTWAVLLAACNGRDRLRGNPAFWLLAGRSPPWGQFVEAFLSLL
jgi:hypothetical protein